MYTKFIKLETTQNTTTADIYIASQSTGDQARRDIKFWTDHGRYQEAEKFFGQPCYTGVRDCLCMVRQYPECGLS